MITTQNYFNEVKKIGIHDLPETLKKSHDLVEKVTQSGSTWATYNSNTAIKSMIDLYFTKLAEYGKTKTPAAAATKKSEQRIFVVRPSHGEKDKAKYESGQTVYISPTADSYYKEKYPDAMVVKNVMKVSRGTFIPGSNASVPTVAFSYVLSNGLSIDEVDLTSVAPKAAATSKKQPVKEPKLPKPERKKSAKVIKENTAKPVERIEDEITLIKKFVNFHGKRKTLDQVYNLLKAVQKAILEKRVNKDSMYSVEVMAVQDSLIAAIGSKAKIYDITIAPKTLSHYQDIIHSVSPMASISLLKRYAGMIGKKDIKEKVKRLEKHFDRAFDKGHVMTNDKYINQVKDAFANIQNYLVGNTPTLEIEQAELNGIKEIWQSAKKAAKNVYQKAAPIAKKLASGTKHAYRVVKASGKAAIDAGRSEHKKVSSGVKKLAAGTKAIFTNKKDPRYSSRVRILKHFADDNTYKVLFLTVPSGSGWSVNEEDNLPGKYLIPGTSENLGFIPEMMAAAAGAFVQHAVKKVIPASTPHLNGVMSVNEVKGSQFKKIGLLGIWKELIGDACKPTAIFIYGPGGSGKSTLSFRLAEVLNNLGDSILYVAAEQFNTPTLTELLNRLDLKTDNNFKLVGNVKTLDPAKFDWIVLDSKDASGFKHSDQFEAFRKKYPNLSFIITSEGLKNKGFKGDEAWRNKVDTMIYCENYVAKADQDKNRWGGKGHLKLS